MAPRRPAVPKEMCLPRRVVSSTRGREEKGLITTLKRQLSLPQFLQSSFSFLYSSPFLNSFLDSFIPSFRRSFLPFPYHSFLSPFIPSFLSFSFHSFLPFFFHSFRPSFLLSFIVLPFSFHSFCPSFLPSSFLNSFHHHLPSFLLFPPFHFNFPYPAHSHCWPAPRFDSWCKDFGPI